MNRRLGSSSRIHGESTSRKTQGSRIHGESPSPANRQGALSGESRPPKSTEAAIHGESRLLPATDGAHHGESQPLRVPGRARDGESWLPGISERRIHSELRLQRKLSKKDRFFQTRPSSRLPPSHRRIHQHRSPRTHQPRKTTTSHPVAGLETDRPQLQAAKATLCSDRLADCAHITVELIEAALDINQHRLAETEATSLSDIA